MEKLRVKIHFKVMNSKVSDTDFNYLRGLFLECLEENKDISEALIENYKHIQVFFFFEQTDPNIKKYLIAYLKYPIISHSAHSDPAYVISRKGLGCIVFFIKHLKERIEKRNDIQNIRGYQKTGIFEELCHLVEQKGDSYHHPESYWQLNNLYISSLAKILSRNEILHRNIILHQLDKNRNHYEVYLMILKAYPIGWMERFWRFFDEESEYFTYSTKYAQWKMETSFEIAFARLITDFLRDLAILYISLRFPNHNLSKAQNDKLNYMISVGKQVVEVKKNLIKKDAPNAFRLIDQIEEKIFSTTEVYFSYILDLWKRLHLV